MSKYTVEHRQYDCHPETCAHWEHQPYWIVEDGYRWYMGFDTKQEALKYLENLNAKTH